MSRNEGADSHNYHPLHLRAHFSIQTNLYLPSRLEALREGRAVRTATHHRMSKPNSDVVAPAICRCRGFDVGFSLSLTVCITRSAEGCGLNGKTRTGDFTVPSAVRPTIAAPASLLDRRVLHQLA
ncbi:hypothetical protein SB778_32005, partial [Paraburkholderia sp. SIMBA_050]